jgi:hypothetical protein
VESTYRIGLCGFRIRGNRQLGPSLSQAVQVAFDNNSSVNRRVTKCFIGFFGFAPKQNGPPVFDWRPEMQLQQGLEGQMVS